MTITKVNVKKFNKKFIVTALGVAALGFQLMQTNDVKADDTADSKTGDAADEQSNMQTKSSSVADSSSIQSNSSNQNNADTTDNTQQSNDNNNQNQSNTDTSSSSQNNSNQSQNGTNTINDVQNSNDSNNKEQTNTDNNNSQNSNGSNIQAESAAVATSDDNDASSNDSTNDGSNPETDSENNTASGEETDTDATTNQSSQNDVAASSNIMIQNPAASREPNTYPDPVKANVSVTATTDEGTVTSESLDEDKNASIIVNKDAQTTLNFSITNTSDEATTDYGTVLILPTYRDHNTPIVLDDSFDPSTMITGLPEGAEITYNTIYDNSYKTLDQLKGESNFKLSDIKQIQIVTNKTSLAPQQEIKATIPLVNTDKSERQLNKTLPGVYVITSTDANKRLQYMNVSYNSMEDSVKSSELTGKYPAVTVNKLGNSYTVADQEIQDKMPTYTGGSDIQVNNFNSSNKDELTDADKSDWTYGGHIYVNLVSSGITNIANKDGYSVLLNADGSQQTQYAYVNKNTGNGVTLTGNSTNSGEGLVPVKTVQGIYISLRHVIDAQDSTATVGQDWSAADNLTSVQDNDDNVLTGDDAINAVSTSIEDPNGVLSDDGKIAKSGSFNVTYTYNLKDGTAITKTVTVTVDPVDSGSSSSSSTSNTGSNTSSTTDSTEPVISPDSPDNINDQVRLVSTNPDDGIVSLYKLDTTEITNRRLGTATDWYSDKDMSFAGDTYYRVATNEWVKASNVYVYENNKVVVQTKNNQQLVDSKGNLVTNRSLIADSDCYSDRIAQINGKDYYRVATNEFVPVDAVTVL
ncbi:hypothetical protein FHL06_11385 [Lactobacillus halodurans]|uniref:Surface layer protein A domain-containing protein n=1 Tax=Companilactobacillus halodurans TaxID=2584183 RepID=A0A5P0ZRU9_9LACO|nr:SLAP domain-containing protein [Companilactobacillus halodurans]MQS76944.1 hypothetical protein [Companilactobacillus halodurans]